MSSALRLVMVVPCYDEAERLDLQAFATFESERLDTTFLFVDDGSRDATAERIEQARARHPERLRLLRLPGNRGKGEAVRAGLLAALDDPELRPELVGYLDADLSTPLSALPLLAEPLLDDEGTGLVLASRVRLLGRRIERTAMRHYVGRVFATAASLSLGLPVYDTQCGAKLVRVGPGLRALLDEPFLSRWSFDVELLARWVRGSLRRGRPAEDGLVEVPLQEWTEVPGSRVRWRDFPVALTDLWRIRRRWLSRRALAGDD